MADNTSPFVLCPFLEIRNSLEVRTLKETTKLSGRKSDITSTELVHTLFMSKLEHTCFCHQDGDSAHTEARAARNWFYKRYAQEFDSQQSVCKQVYTQSDKRRAWLMECYPRDHTWPFNIYWQFNGLTTTEFELLPRRAIHVQRGRYLASWVYWAKKWLT